MWRAHAEGCAWKVAGVCGAVRGRRAGPVPVQEGDERQGVLDSPSSIRAHQPGKRMPEGPPTRPVDWPLNMNHVSISIPDELVLDGDGRRTQGGSSRNDIVHSAAVAGNAEVFPEVMRLHVPRGAVVADVTYGKGVFWRNIDLRQYTLRATDLQMGVDATDLPYDEDSLDALVLDPPYMEGLFRKSTDHMAGGGTHGAFRTRYSDGKATQAAEGRPKWHDAVLDLYFRAGVEARRCLKVGGTFIVKCQDEVSANRQRLTHVELINHFEGQDFYCKDLFVVVRNNRPGISRVKKQVHARKNHSYFLVFVLCPPGKAGKAKSVAVAD